MSSKTKRHVLGLGILAAAALGAAGSWQILRARPATTARASSAEPAPRAAKPAAQRRQWKVGSSYVYAIDSARAMSIGKGDKPGRELGWTAAGRLSITVVEATPTSVRLRAELESPRHGETDGAIDDASLARAFYVDALPDGRLESFWFAKGISAEARGVLTGLVSSLQLVVPSPADAWKTIEHDTSGEYEASYRKSGSTVRKSKTRYLRAARAGGFAPIGARQSYDVRASSDFTLDPSGWPSASVEEEALTVTAESIRIVSRVRTEARLVEVTQVSGLAELVASEQGSLEPASAVAERARAASKQSADRSLLAGATLETIVGDLRAQDPKVKNRAMARASALFRLEPRQIARAVDSIVRGDLDDGSKQRLVGALGAARSKRGDDALATILGAGDAGPAARSNAAALLGASEDPTAEGERALRSAMSSDDPLVASAATLAEGSLVKRMNESGEGDPNDALDALIQKLSAATTDDERTLCLQALGNSGAPRALAAIEPYLTYAVVDVRAVAVDALRFMGGAGVDAALRAALRDPDVTVRRAAAGTLRYRAITPILDTVEEVLEHDDNLGVRLTIVAAMGVRKLDDPAVMEALAWAVENDPAAEVRAAAKSALGPT